MAVEDRVRWDNNYKKKNDKPYPSADPLLKDFTPLADNEAMPRALDLAGGVGQNGLWLAEQGYASDIMDISRVALQRARAEMGMRNLRNANLLQIDVDKLDIDPATYDLICVFRYLKRDLFPFLKEATKPNGRIIYETFNLRYLDVVPQFNRDFLLEDGELEGYFSDWQIIYSEEEEQHISQLVAVKPS
ncbi:MAG: class I SAM-dependent methyltransferase [Anaerolineae bacterium]|nr:class I SAM-dependent methyltransferase [Anaerolineae bacterium]